MTIAVPIKEAARIVGVSERTMRRWVEQRHVKSWVPSRRRRYVDLEDALAYRSRRRVA